MISITSTDGPDVNFPRNPMVCGIFRIRVNDLTQAYDEEGIPYGRPLPRAEDLRGLKDFVDGLACERLLIHCWEGTSRSAAVAAAVCEYRGGGDTLATGQRFAPNPLVYALCCREFGIRPGNLVYRALPGEDGQTILEKGMG